MRLINITVIVCVLTASSCRGEIIIQHLGEDELITNLINGTIDILTSCYGGRIHGIGLAGPLSDRLSRILTTQYFIPVVLFPTTSFSRYRPPPRAPIQFRQKLQVFLVSGEDLRSTINHIIKPSIWWNPMAVFFYLTQSEICFDDTVLLSAWDFNLLHAKVICVNNLGTIVTAFNPFIGQAPDPWEYTRVWPIYSRGKEGQFLYVFTSIFPRNEPICMGMDFDSTMDAGGYEIRVEGHPPNSLVPVRTKTNRAEYEHSVKMARILGTVYRTMNATPVFTFTKKFSKPITEDMFAVSDIIRFKWTDDCSTTYPHERVGFVLVTQFRGHKSQLNKILTVTDIESRIGLGIVYLITLLFFKIFVRQALVPVFLNLIRITCSSSFANLPDNNPARIYLTGLLFFVVTMQGIYQGNLATLLTTRIPVKNVETMEDVIDFGYELYGDPFMEIVIPYPELRKRFIPVRLNGCISHVLEDSSAACMAVLTDKVLDKAREFDLHVSGELIGTEYKAFTIRWDWPLEHRMNRILGTMFEADVLEPWLHRCDPIKLIDFKYDKEVLSNTNIKILELSELAFAFIILGIGLAFATVTFILELAIAYKCTILRRDIIN